MLSDLLALWSLDGWRYVRAPNLQVKFLRQLAFEMSSAPKNWVTHNDHAVMLFQPGDRRPRFDSLIYPAILPSFVLHLFYRRDPSKSISWREHMAGWPHVTSCLL